MRIGTWNCRGAFAHHGEEALDELDADVLVVPEARPTSTAAAGGWTVAYRPVTSKGIGIFVRAGWGVDPFAAPGGVERPWEHVLEVSPPDGEPFLVIGFWAVSGPPRYTAQFTDLLDRWEPVLRDRPVVVAGDFNASGVNAHHRANLERAAETGLVSAYHAFGSTNHGEEPEMTLRWVAPGRVERRYHCDLVLVPARWMPRVTAVEVGAWSVWVGASRSDHVPVIVALERSEPAAGIRS